MRGLPVLILLLLPLLSRAARTDSSAEVRAPEPRKVWEAMVETTQTIGADNSRDNYFATQFVSLAVEPFRPLRVGPVRVRAQLINSFVVSAILDGPDTYYLGWAPQVRAIVPLGESQWSVYAAFAAGLGYADANENNPDDGGLGQDFNFLLMSTAGLRYALTESWSVWAGGVWMHLSNGGASEPRKENIGADSFGAMLGVGWSF